MEACRSPITTVFRKVLNVLSLGKLNREMAKQSYDDLFHLYAIIHLANGKIYSIEKNERIAIYNKRKTSKEAECVSTPVSGKTLEQFVLAPEVDMEGLYQYDAFRYNCQDWVSRLFNANGITKFDGFILQNTKDLVPGILKKISKGITNVAAVGNYLYHGGAMEGVEVNKQ